ncbi:MAG: helix-hairpin-helix domain-containing protein [Pricia sp.]
MKNVKSHFRFNKQERSGIFFLLLIIVSLQVGYFFFNNLMGKASDETLVVDSDGQAQIDALKEAALKKDSVRIFPFNPNFITDYKGYVLGMSKEEIDRLHAFRKQERFANTAEEFQQVTQISDSLLDAISPNFKFPEWTQKKRKRSPQSGVGYTRNSVSPMSDNGQGRAPDFAQGKAGGVRNESPSKISDLNTATAEELRSVYGIGAKLSARIVKFRDRLGGFLVDDQLYDVYGLEPEVVERALKKFRVISRPNIQKININKATAQELSELVYIQKPVAERILNYRNDNGSITSLEELRNIEDFPSERIPRIALYLSL